MQNFLIIIFYFLFILFSNAKEEKEYKFNWYPIIDVKDNVIKFPDSSRYETYNSSGVWEDSFGNYLGSGIYFYQLRTDNFSQTKKMIISR